MAGVPGTITLRTIDRLGDVSASAWDTCAGGANPFVSHAFLCALEESGSANGRTGWRAHHLLVEDAKGQLVACAPLYLKTHSYGEYVFDHGWAEAYAKAGGRYYPKLQLAVPFSPVPGPRLLLRDRHDATLRIAIARGLVDIARRSGVSSLHATFCSTDDVAAFEAAGFLIRTSFQYHWHNGGYRNFDEFLAALNHGKRKAIRKERREVAAQGVTLEILSGDALTRAHWDAFFEFYISTSDRKWGSPYLNRAFFDLLHDSLRDRVALVLGRHDGAWVCGALNLIGEDTLYGRNWGASEAFKHLHFEACYYQAIEFAIARKLARVEAGAQGDHKLQRGYLPVRSWSAHWLREPGFERAVREFLTRERRGIDGVIAELDAHSPFRRAGS
ncbi:MAG: N-acetyltransferase [Alphaproteobacteria bacterium]|nr:N-acetyltransferase [Alphaproteobacteria bacterium]